MGRANLKADEFTDLLSLIARNLLSLYNVNTRHALTIGLRARAPRRSSREAERRSGACVT
jgi:hypothetical protein